MSTSELVTSQHLQKKAVIYIRQSTPHQQISNQESLRLQYALQERAQRLGWHAQDVEVIDADLGLTATSAQHRTGFQELVAKVTLGQVGIILSVEVTRLSRNCSAWYPLLDVCGYRGFLNAEDLALPRRDRFGDVVWKKPTVAIILQILKNPAYAGAFVYGRTRSLPRDPAALRSKQVRLPMEQWRIRVNDVYPAYISWETFERIQQMLLDNYAAYDRNKSRGVPRDGAALLHGIVYCGECGHKMVVQYKHGTRYICN